MELDLRMMNLITLLLQQYKDAVQSMIRNADPSNPNHDMWQERNKETLVRLEKAINYLLPN